jgi:hypothetical protein
MGIRIRGESEMRALEEELLRSAKFWKGARWREMGKTADVFPAASATANLQEATFSHPPKEIATDLGAFP